MEQEQHHDSLIYNDAEKELADIKRELEKMKTRAVDESQELRKRGNEK